MDTNRLRYFIVVAETGSIRKAAEICHISPAALSKAIKQLEYEVGTTLLLPEGRGIVVTDEGERLAAEARPLLSALDDLSAKIKGNRPLNKRPFVIGSFEVFTTYLIGPLLTDYLGDITITLHEVIPGELEKALLDRTIDVGITYLPIPTAGIEHVKISAIKMGVFGRTGKFNNIPFNEIPFVVPTTPITGTPTKVRGLDGWPDDRLERNIRYRVTLMESAMEICRRGLAAAYLPIFVARLHNVITRAGYRLAEISHPLLKSQKQSVFLAKRKTDVENNALINKLSQAVKNICLLGE